MPTLSHTIGLQVSLALCYQSTRRSGDTAAPDILRLFVVVAATAGQIAR